MELPPNPTQIELRAWSNARQALGPNQHDELSEPTRLTTRLTNVASSTMNGNRTVETRSVDVRQPATRRGGSPTKGRKAPTPHNPQPTTGMLTRDVPGDTTTSPSTAANNGTSRGLFDLFLSFGDPRLTLALTVATVLFVMAVL